MIAILRSSYSDTDIRIAHVLSITVDRSSSPIQIIQISDPTLLENLDMRQRQTLVGRELASWRAGAKRRSLAILSKSGSL